MTDKQRADYPNLILLCIQHHDETNDVIKYPVEVLKKMKSEHEAEQLNNCLQKNPSMLMNAISALDFGELNEQEALDIFDPRDKIKFNDLKKMSH